MWALAIVACKGNQVDVPKRIEGTWEVHQIEVGETAVEAAVAVTNGHPGCTWGRIIMSFELDGGVDPMAAPADRLPGHLTSNTDVLCPTQQSGEMFGCSVSARVPAEWDVHAGKWIVADGATVRNRTRPVDVAAIASGTSCEAKVSAGEYLVEQIRGQKWKWEMLTPSGTVYRLRAPQSDRPDFVAALQRQQQEASSPLADGSEGGK
jgi:hypothetical protein